jgi:hypothetical protein
LEGQCTIINRIEIILNVSFLGKEFLGYFKLEKYDYISKVHGLV